MKNNALSSVMVYLQNHRDFVQADFMPLAKLDMAMLPTKGDVIDIREYTFSDTGNVFDPVYQVLRVDGVYIAYERVGGFREIVSVCGTAINRPRFF